MNSPLQNEENTVPKVKVKMTIFYLMFLNTIQKKSPRLGSQDSWVLSMVFIKRNFFV